MPTPVEDDHLLFGLLALKNGWITQDQLLSAFEKWSGDFPKPIDRTLEESGALTGQNIESLRHGVQLLRNPDLNQSTLLATAENPDPTATISPPLADGHAQTLLGDLDQTLPPKSPAAAFPDSPKASTSPDRRFRILRPLDGGAGGMGVIHVAEDSELGRQVALKQIRTDRADDDAYRQKFQVEAEITGNLEHPGIVPIYGLGQDDAGRPYYAMRLVRGENLEHVIKQFHRQLTDKETDYTGTEFYKLIDRMIDVAQAIEYAHHRGVLHRDLKPGNVLVGEYGETVVIDWGLARLPRPEGDTADDLAAASVNDIGSLKIRSGSNLDQTAHGSLMGTISYAPPEQIQGNVQQVGPRSDVYGLGAILYQMLTGQRTVKTKGRATREVVTEVIQGNISPPHSRDSRIPKALSAICMKALDRDPEQRYGTSAEFIAELERWKADQPVLACPESITERAARFARKHRSAAVALTTTAVVVAIVSMIAFALVSEQKRRADGEAIAARTAEQMANEAKNNESLQRQRAEEAREEAEEAQKDAERLKELAVIAKEAAERLQRDAEMSAMEARAAKEDAVKARGEAEEAAELAIEKEKQAVLSREVAKKEKAIAEEVTRFLTHELLGSASPYETPFTDIPLRHVVDRAAIRIAQREFDGDDDGLVRASIRHTLGWVYLGLGEYKSARPHVEAAVKLRKQALIALGDRDHQLEDLWLQSLNNQAWLTYREGNLAEARALFVQILTAQRNRDGWQQDAATLRTMNHIAHMTFAEGDLVAAEKQFLKVYDERLSLLGEEHIDTLSSLSALGNYYRETGDYGQAQTHCERALNGHNTSKGLGQLFPNAPETFSTMHNLGDIYYAVEEYEDAVEQFANAYEKRIRVLGASHPSTISSLRSLALSNLKDGELQHAFEQLKWIVDNKAFSDDAEENRNTFNGLGDVCIRLERFEDAQNFLTNALNDVPLQRGSDSDLNTRQLLGLALFELAKRIAGELVRQHDDLKIEQRRDLQAEIQDTIERSCDQHQIVLDALRQRGQPKGITTLKARHHLYLAEFYREFFGERDNQVMETTLREMNALLEEMKQHRDLGPKHPITRQLESEAEQLQEKRRDVNKT